ncbi:MAG: tetratricopeptide repeat protein [Bacteroidales bacterium]|nr:tetratricopeptide repeat protein [Bacteroidales bacterium]
MDSLLMRLQYVEDDSCRLTFLCGLSDYYLDKDLSKSLDYSYQALELAGKMGYASQVAFIQFKRGELFLNLGDYDEASKQLLQSLKNYESSNNSGVLYKVYNNIGVMCDRIADFDKALDYYFKALDVYNEQLSKGEAEGFLNLHTLYNNIGNIYFSRSEISIAHEYYQKALELSKSLGDYKNMGVIYNNLGKLYSKQKNYSEAYDYLQRSLKCRQSINDKNGMAISYNFLGDYYIQVEDFGNALAVIQKSLELGKEVGSLPSQMVAYQLFNEVYEQEGEVRKALDAYKLYKQISDSIINEKTIQEITKTRMQLEFDKKEKLVKAEQEKQKFKYGLIISILSLGFIISGLFYSLLRNRTKRIYLEKKQLDLEKENLEKDLEIRNKELTTNVMYLVQKNVIVSNITTKMMDLKKRLKPDSRGGFQEIIMELHAVVDKEAWEEFEYRFQQVHTGFYTVLQEEFPDLTPGEKKLAAFLLLNMTTKEISSIMGISPNGVDKARYRLRKKMGIANRDVNLVNFLTKLSS